MALPLNDQALSYNGYSFDSMHHSRVQLRPVYDQAQRTVTYSRLEIHVTAWVNAATQDDLETALATMSRELQRPGGILTYTGKGIRLVVNGADGSPDVKWGPSPQSFDVRIIGAGRSVLVDWSCFAHIVMTCTNTVGALLAFNTEVAWDITVDGLTTKSVSGYLEIPLTRKAVGNRTVADSADRHWDKVLTDDPTPEGYRREDRRRNVSADRRTLTFSYVDRQLPHARGIHLPDGTTQAQATHNLAGSLFKSGVISGGLVNWTGEFSANLTTPPGRPKSDAVFTFFLLISKSLRIGANFARLGGGPTPGTLLITNIDFGDEVFGLTSRFRLGYALAGMDMATAVRTSGLYQPIPGTSWASWQRSIAAAQSARGMGQLAFDHTKDVIVDLCATVAPKNRLVNQPVGGQLLSNVPNGQSVIKPEHSWLYYNCRLRLLEKNNIVRHTPLGPRLQNNSAADALAYIGQNISGTDLHLDKGDYANVLQEVGSTPSCTLVLTGTAIRLGFAPPIPELLKVPGCEIRRTASDTETFIATHVGGIPIWVSRWTKVYACDRAPTSLPAPGDPSLGLSGQNQNVLKPTALKLPNIPATPNLNVLRPK